MTDPVAPPAPVLNQDSPRGFAFALTAYVIWGFMPLYMKLVAHLPTVEVLAHRVIWSVPIAGVVLILLRRTGDLRRAIVNPRMLGMAAVTAALVSVNWGIYVWSIAAGRALDAALGYFINPIFSVALGAILLKERLTRLQMAALMLVVAAVGVLTWEAGGLPWVALALTVTWGFYAFFRKTLPIGPNQGFMLEVLILSPFALGYFIWAQGTGVGNFHGWQDILLLLGCGVVTAGPLMIYANGAKLLRLSTIGMLQYVAPTMVFLQAVFLFNEPFGATKLLAFCMIWTALALYTSEMLRLARR
jgi:chloramphenicol-sensitive protein RarD